MVQKNNRPKFKLEFRSNSNLLKIVVTVLIIFSMAALMALAWVRSGIENQIQALKQETAALEQENQDLQEKIDGLGSVQSVQDIAREELGLVDPNTIVIQPE